ncbi:coiled-coil domain-containing protein [Peribacillus sp. SCS-155]|uniref:coiled-coil domain-containing protein n=1 Tax=Peribacillus sedimenti TaxID=3115297 RepID=UPI003905D0A5
MKRKMIALNTTIMIGLGSIFSIPAVHAESVQKLQSEKAKVEKKRSEVKARIGTVQDGIANIQKDKDKIVAQLKRIVQALKDNNLQLQETALNIQEKNDEIESLEGDVKVLQDRIEKRNVILKERAVSFQESGGGIDYLEVILGSKSFGNFLDRVSAIATIVDADKDILAEHEADKLELEDTKNAVEEKLTALEEMKAELQGLRADIEAQKKENEALKKNLQQKEKESRILKASLEKKDAKLGSQVAAIMRNIQTEKARQAALEAARQREIAEAKKRAAQESQQSSRIAENNSQPVKFNDGYSGSSSKALAVATVGNKYIGNSVYVWGGGRNQSDVENGRFDCSGFVAWAYSQVGIRVGAHTDLLKNTGRTVSISEAKVGDLVFFNTYKTDGHVGIYVGNGKFIGSQGSTGVAIADMTSGYYGERFNGRVKRIIE